MVEISMRRRMWRKEFGCEFIVENEFMSMCENKEYQMKDTLSMYTDTLITYFCT